MDEHDKTDIVQPGMPQILPLRQLSSDELAHKSSSYSSFETQSRLTRSHMETDDNMDVDDLEGALPNENAKEELDLACSVAPVSFSGSLGLQSIEDFDKEERRRENPELVLFNSSVRSPDIVNEFNNTCQRLAIVPYFEIHLLGDTLYSGKLIVGSHLIELKGTFSSKKHVKDALCTKGMPMLGSFDLEESKKRKRLEIERVKQVLNADCTARTSPEDLEYENWVSILQSKSFNTIDEYAKLI